MPLGTAKNSHANGGVAVSTDIVSADRGRGATDATALSTPRVGEIVAGRFLTG